jgi:hypothetical protein
MVTTIEKEAIKTYKDLTLDFVPAAAYAYTVGSTHCVKKR